MATPAQIAANRRNALRSTGPRTPEGKARVARNRLVHGLRARASLLPGENPFEFLALLCRLQAELRPRTALESCCVLEIARARWKVSRADWLEVVLSERAAPDFRTVGLALGGARRVRKPVPPPAPSPAPPPGPPGLSALPPRRHTNFQRSKPIFQPAQEPRCSSVARG